MAAPAQETTTFYKSTGGVSLRISYAHGTNGLAQVVRTGEHPQGYTLTSVDLYVGSSHIADSSLSVWVYGTGAPVATLQYSETVREAPSTIHASFVDLMDAAVYTAPPNTVLEANTTYVFELNHPSSGAGAPIMRLDDADRNFAAAGIDWEWGVTGLMANRGGGGWVPMTFDDREYIMRIAFKGYRNASAEEQAAEAQAPTVDGAPRVNGEGQDGNWTTGETVDVTVAFSEAVDVDASAGTPSVGIGLGGPGGAARNATYASGSGTTELVFRYTLVEGDGAHSAMAVTGDSLALNGGTIRSVETGADATLAHNGAAVVRVSGRGTGPQVSFPDLPETHDGESGFKVWVQFSGAPSGLSPENDAASVLEVEGGTVTAATAETKDAASPWSVTVAPDGTGDVTVRIPVRECTEAGAVCIGGQPLTEAAEATVPGPQAVGCPAPALAGGAVLVWTGQIGIAKWPGNEYYGFGNGVRGTLDDRDFTLGSNDYVVDHVTQRGGSTGPLLFSLESSLSADEKRTLTLHVCEDGKQLRLSDASAPSRYHTYQWSDTGGLDWSTHAERTLHLIQDAAAPTLTAATVAGTSLALAFSETLAAASGLSASAFTVTADASPVTVSAVQLDADTVTLTLASAVSDGAAVTVSYAQPTGASNRLRDRFDNLVANITGRAVESGTVAAALPAVSIAAGSTPVTEGTSASFTLTRTGATEGALTVTVSVSETGAAVSGTAPTEVAFAAESSTATLSVATEDDEAVEATSTVTVTVTVDEGYTVDGTSGSAEVAVEDDDAAPAVTTATPIEVAENATAVASLAATDADTPIADLSWSIPEGEAGGADAAAFEVTAEGVLTFKAAKDFEAPDDADADGAYEVTVRVTDGANPVDAPLVVRLADADEAAPELSSASVDGSALTLTFNEALDEGSVPPASSFSVTVAGSARTVESVSVSGSAVTLTLASAVTSGETVTVGYTVPTGADSTPVEDAAGNAATAFADEEVTNETAANETPAAACPAPALTGGATLVWTGRLGIAKWPGNEFYGFGHGVRGTLDDRDFTLGSNDYLVDHVTQRGGSTGPLLFSLESGLSADEKRTLTLHACEDGKQLRLSDASGPSRSHTYQWNRTGGLDWSAHAERTLHLVQDEAAPTLTAATVAGASLALAFSETLAAASGLSASAFTVTSDASPVTVSAVQLDADTVTLTLASAVSAGAAVTVSYAQPAGAGNRLRDRFDNLVANITGRTVDSGTVAGGTLPAVSIAAASTPVTEGTSAAFTLTRTGPAAAALEVSVSVSEAGSVLDGTPPTSATFAAGSSSTQLAATTENDATYEADARITASVVAGDGYTVDGASAGVDVFDDDTAPPGQQEAVETLWSTTMLWKNVGYGWFGGYAEVFDEPEWTEDGTTFRIWFIDYHKPRRELRIAQDGSGGPIADPEELSLQIGGYSVEDQAVRAFAGVQTGVVRGIDSQWTAGEEIEIRLTRRTGEMQTAPALPGLSVADAQVDEASGTPLRFTVRLAEAAQTTVSVRYATSDGSARAGEDYVGRRGAVRFAPGQTEKTVAIEVLPDEHDEGSETMTLTLSRPFGATPADATATGTISNTGPMPAAWLARFGRTVAEQAIEAVQGRFEAVRGAGFAGTLAGQALPGSALHDEAALEAGDEPGRGLGTVSEWLRGETGEDDNGDTYSMSARELLTSSSFSMTGGTSETGFASFWGRGAVTRFDGRDGEVSLDGEVSSAMLGADFSRDRLLAGLMLSHSQGEGGYRGGSGSGTVESTLTALFPYARYALDERLSVWGMAGYGAGTLTLTPEGGAPLRPDMDFAMAAFGVRSVLLDGGAEGTTLAAKSDAFAVRTGTDAVSGDAGRLEAAQADVTRVRLALEGSRPFSLGETTVFTPSLELGVRHDGGDAETGFGGDIGAGLALSDPLRGLSAELRARGLLTHEDGGMRDRGLSGTLAFDPASETGRGLSPSLTQTVGGQASGGADSLLERTTLAGLGADDGGGLSARRLDARVGLRVRGIRRALHVHARVRVRALRRGPRIPARLAARRERLGGPRLRAGAGGDAARVHGRRRRGRRARRRRGHGLAAREPGRGVVRAAPRGDAARGGERRRPD